ncbi:hypothetical protein C2S53_020741 [Perilla frutescens var. hirtella]|uniref:Leucine-rich repeat-containing N-terminal plant-type domain-containing protein n=1 Tax=Perilla frutescens var. hirtella TaxID=608512 RepID=A0AAD4IR12_PERFH|nr:hypothetical protein C2S53_020741 [Perilla frutescens var. hirtella]
MEAFSQKSLLPVLLLFHCLMSYGLANKDTTTSHLQSDQSSLLVFKSKIIDPHNMLKNNWTTATSVCSWVGVTCDKNSSVIELDISDMELAGSIPPEIDNLPLLVSLNMANNNFTGSIPPTIFNNMSRLEFIHLDGNNLSGEIPKEIGHLTILRILSMESQNLTGPIPREIGNMTSLEQLQLTNNSLTSKFRPFQLFTNWFNLFFDVIIALEQV